MSVDISKMDAVELDALIARATQRRTELQPEVPRTAPRHSYGHFDPVWQVRDHGDNTVLEIRHPGFGWITFIIPPNERANLLTVLLRMALHKSEPQPLGPAQAETKG